MAKKMGYVFPKRMRDVMNGDNPYGTSIGYNMKTKEEREEIEKQLEKEKKEKEKRMQIFAENSMFCPVCGKFMNDFDLKMKNIRGYCSKCGARVDGYLKLHGMWKSYEENIALRNYKSKLINIKAEAEEFLLNLKDEIKIVNHDGTFDTLKGDNEKVKKFIKHEIEDINEKLKEVEDIDLNISIREVIGLEMSFKELAKKLYLEEKERKEKYQGIINE